MDSVAVHGYVGGKHLWFRKIKNKKIKKRVLLAFMQVFVW